MGGSDARARIIAQAKAMQDDQRYGHFTHPVMLGLLLAAELLDADPTDPKR
jgi:hypothetical protein